MWNTWYEVSQEINRSSRDLHQGWYQISLDNCFFKPSSFENVFTVHANFAKKSLSRTLSRIPRSSLIHFACVGVAPPILVTPQAKGGDMTSRGEQLQFRHNWIKLDLTDTQIVWFGFISTMIWMNLMYGVLYDFEYKVDI